MFNANEGISNNNKSGYFYLSRKAVTRKTISISFALFTISILLVGSTVVVGVPSTDSSNNNIVSGINGNNNNSLQKHS
jgi:hypothetical protein